MEIKKEIENLLNKYNRRGKEIEKYIKNRTYFAFQPATIKEELPDVNGNKNLLVSIPIPRTSDQYVGYHDEFLFETTFSQDSVEAKMKQLRNALNIYSKTLNVFLDSLRVKNIDNKKYLVGRITNGCLKSCLFAINEVCNLKNDDLAYRSSQAKCKRFICNSEQFVRDADEDESLFLCRIRRELK